MAKAQCCHNSRKLIGPVLWRDGRLARPARCRGIGAKLYIPEFNRIEDRALTLAFLRANPFATLISTTETGPFATHVPILAHEADGHLHLRGHMAKANPHWKSLAQDQESLVIFSGPHAYISPSLYEIRESVPTWNYAAVD